MIKHFTWQHEGERGRVAVKIEGDTIELRQIAGNAPPAAIAAWHNAINNAFPGNVMATASLLHSRRVNRFAVLRHVGMSGAINFRLVVEKNADLSDFPTVAVLHVSMAGKLNQGMKMWLGDYAAIFDAWLAQDGQSHDGISALDEDDLQIVEVPTRDNGIAWQTPPVRILHASPWAETHDED